MQAIKTASANGARYRPICKTLGISYSTYLNWVSSDLPDQRKGPNHVANKLSEKERAEVVEACASEKYRDYRPDQVANLLLDEGIYLGSPSTFYRVLRDEKLNASRCRKKTKRSHTVPRLCAEAPNEVWSWDITYLKTHIKGLYFYLYLIMDIYSRKIVGWSVHDEETAALASHVVTDAKKSEALSENHELTLHSDNGSPMKGSTMLATLRDLHIATSNSRPGVSNDNAFSESLFSTLKSFPTYPKDGFSTIEEARLWATKFSYWYNNKHYHSRLNHIRPIDRHNLKDENILQERKEVIERAKEENPERWIKGSVRNMEITKKVYINRKSEQKMG